MSKFYLTQKYAFLLGQILIQSAPHSLIKLLLLPFNILTGNKFIRVFYLFASYRLKLHLSHDIQETLD